MFYFLTASQIRRRQSWIFSIISSFVVIVVDGDILHVPLLAPELALVGWVHRTADRTIEHLRKSRIILKNAVGAVFARTVCLFRILLVAVSVQYFAPNLSWDHVQKWESQLLCQTKNTHPQLYIQQGVENISKLFILPVRRLWKRVGHWCSWHLVADVLDGDVHCRLLSNSYRPSKRGQVPRCRKYFHPTSGFHQPFYHHIMKIPFESTIFIAEFKAYSM